MLATVSSQILSITAFAGLFGYDLVAELQSVVDMMSGMGMAIDLQNGHLDAYDFKVTSNTMNETSIP